MYLIIIFRGSFINSLGDWLRESEKLLREIGIKIRKKKGREEQLLKTPICEGFHP